MKNILTVIVISVLAILVLLGIRYVMAPLFGIVQVQEQTNSGDYRMYNYEQYFNQCAAIQGYETAIDVQKESLQYYTDPADVARVKTNISAITAQRARAIAQYNVDVAKVTKNKYFDKSLPLTLNVKDKTVCVN